MDHFNSDKAKKLGYNETMCSSFLRMEIVFYLFVINTFLLLFCAAAICKQLLSDNAVSTVI